MILFLGEMEQKERLLTALKGGIPDKVPNFEVWWGGNEGIEEYFLGRPVIKPRIARPRIKYGVKKNKSF